MKNYMPDDPKERKKIIDKVVEYRSTVPPMGWKDLEKKVKLAHGTIMRMFIEEGYDVDKIRTRRGPGDWEKVEAEIAKSGLPDEEACEALGISHAAYKAYLKREGKGRVAKGEKDGNGHDEPRGLGVGLIRRISTLEQQVNVVSRKLDRIVRVLS